MKATLFPTINPQATGRRILELRKERGLSVRDLQDYFGFDAPQAIYKWQKGAALPSVDNLLALSALLEVPMEAILVTSSNNFTLLTHKEPDGSVFYVSKSRTIPLRLSRFRSYFFLSGMILLTGLISPQSARAFRFSSFCLALLIFSFGIILSIAVPSFSRSLSIID